MARPTKQNIFKQNLKVIFKDLSSKRVYSDLDLISYLDYAKQEKYLAKTTSFEEFKNYLDEENALQIILFKFPNRKFERFIFQEDKSAKEDLSYYDMLNLVASFNYKGYFSHYTAAFLNDITDNIVKTFYFSFSTTRSNTSNRLLTQEGIDAAFSKPSRKSNKISNYKGNRIVLLQNTFRDKGIVTSDKIKYTNIEKTLLDITVRPDYSGGPLEVLNIYKNAKEKKFSANRLRSYLLKSNYAYPYHQAIGFYMEYAGYSRKQISYFESFPKNYKFYLGYNLNNYSFSEKWQIFYPSELD